MTRVIADISISLDGFVTGPHAGPANGLGDGGEALHTWAFSDDPADQQVVRQATARSGAVVMGRTLFDIVDGPDGWNATNGVADAVGTARGLAARESTRRGEDLDVVIMGGGAVIAGALEAGVVDVLSLHLAPVVLGGGTALFREGTHVDLRRTACVATSTATHVSYDVLRP